MKKSIYLLFFLPVSLMAQLYVSPSETVTVLEGTDVFFGNGTAGVEVDATGLLDIQSNAATTNCVIDGEILGDNRINFGDKTILNIDNGTWNVNWDSPTENNEVLHSLILDANGFAIVPPGNSLTIDEVLLIDNSGTAITLRADASGYAQLLTAGTITNSVSGTVLAEQFLKSESNEGWRQLASPVTTTLADLDDDFTIKNANTTTNPLQYNVFWYDASPVGTSGGAGGTNASENTSTTFSSANAKHWTVASDNTEFFGPSNNAKAWNIYTGGSFPSLDLTTAGKIDVEGLVGNGDYTFDCYATHDVIHESGQTPFSVDQELITGWNLIPNPYPSNINTSALLNDAFFSGTATTAYGAIHIWYPSGPSTNSDQYMAITDGIVTTVNWNTGNGSSSAAPNIAPFQAFWVKTAQDPASGNLSVEKTLTLTNTMRTVNNAGNYFKNTPPLIRLNVLETKENWTDQTVIAFDDASTLAIDNNDAVKFFSPNEKVPSLYTTVAGTPITINRLPSPEPSYSLPLFLDSKKSGEQYDISMQDENTDPSWTIFLEDKKTGKMTNLRTTTYSFAHDGSIKDNRFVVHINKFQGNIDANSYNNISVYSSSNGINVAFANPEDAQAEITISNIAGQLLYQGTVSTGHLFTFPTRGNVSLYAVRVVTGTKMEQQKIIK